MDISLDTSVPTWLHWVCNFDLLDIKNKMHDINVKLYSGLYLSTDKIDIFPGPTWLRGPPVTNTD